MPTEYCRTFKYVDDGSHGMGSGKSYIDSTNKNWKVSGATDNRIGQVTRIVCTRYFSVVYSTGKITANCTLDFTSPAKTVTSASFSEQPFPDKMFTFTWSGADVEALTNEQINSGWRLTVNVTAGLPNASNNQLYWKATKGDPVVLQIYFYDWNDMIGNSTPPTLTAAGITVNGAINGLYLRGQSNISIAVKATIDSKYAANLVNNYSLTLTQSNKQIYSGSQTVKGAGAATFNVGTISNYGAVTVNAKMTDNVNRTVSATKSFTVTEYTGSTITGVSGKKLVERCKKVTDEFGSGESYVASSEGTIALLNVGAIVYNAGSTANTGTLSVTYGTGRTPGTGQINSSVTLGTATASKSLDLRDEHTKIKYTFSTTQEYWFRFKLTDTLGLEVTRDEFFDKAETIFSIEPYGVAVGQLSTGTSSNKKFECAYPATFKGGVTFSGGTTTFSGATTFSSGITDSKGYRMDYVSKTQKLAISDAHFTADTGVRTPMISRVGPIVFLEGGVNCAVKTDILNDTTTSEVTLCTLPTWAKPRVTVSQLVQCPKDYICWLRVETSGAVIISRYRHTTTYSPMSPGDVFLFTASWLAADAAATV